MATDLPRHRASVDKTHPTQSFLTQTINYDSHYVSRVMDDVVSRPYKERIAAGEVIINPLLFVSESLWLPVDFATYRYVPEDATVVIPDSASANIMREIVGYVPQTDNIGGWPTNVDAAHEVDLRKQLALSFVDKPQYGFGEDLFEIAETIRFLKSPMRSIHKLFKAFDKDAAKAVSRKGHVLSLARKSEAIAGVWASYSFALAPLIRSVENALEAIHDTSILKLRRTSRSLGSISDETVRIHTGSSLGSSFWHVPAFGGSVKVTTTQKIDFHAGIIYDAPQRAGQVNLLRSKLGLRDKDLLTTAWEVLPMSFMIDRVVSIKNSLQSFTNLVDPTVSIKGGFVTKRTTSTVSHLLTDCEIGIDGKYDSFSFTALPHTRETFTYERELWNPTAADALPLPNPRELVNSLSKTADLLALTTLILSPLIRKYYVYK